MIYHELKCDIRGNYVTSEVMWKDTVEEGGFEHGLGDLWEVLELVVEAREEGGVEEELYWVFLVQVVEDEGLVIYLMLDVVWLSSHQA